MQPLFEHLLSSIRLTRSTFTRTEYREPWGIRVAEPGIVFHMVASGEGWLKTPDTPVPKHIPTGDYVVLTRGKPHTLRGDGPATLVRGGMELADSATDPLLAVLPPVIYVRQTPDARQRVQTTMERVCGELRSGNFGAREVTTRIADLLLIQAVRQYFANPAEQGWLAAVGDPQIGRAISLLHLHPGEPWSVASLAQRVALSRSAFAGRFTELVGEPPLRYLTRVRLNGAARRLRTSRDKLKSIAAQSGYESVTAFIRAFRRHVGVTPREYRTNGE